MGNFVEVVVPMLVGTGLGALCCGGKGALIGGTLGTGVGVVVAIRRGPEPTKMGPGQKVIQGTAGVLARAGLDPIGSI